MVYIDWVITMKQYIFPEKIEGKQLKKLREKMGVSQRGFAKIINVSVNTVEKWEGENKELKGPILILYTILNKNPHYLDEFEVPKRKYPLRLFYKMEDIVCTVIDVDELNQKVKIYNYTDNLLFRAFGKIENPTFKEYEEFLESRCFPRTRDNIKLELRKLDLPFYDPLLIIEKTQGRMSEDEFYITIER